MRAPIFIDSDNAMGSRSGDVDDALAIAALIRSDQPVVALASVFGNTSEARAHDNNVSLSRLCGFGGPLLRGATSAEQETTEAVAFLTAASRPLRIAALGPLTNVAGAIESARERLPIEEIVMVGSNSNSFGRWPPLWPYEFNLTKDRRATRICFETTIPMTVFPLNVASRFRFSRSLIAHLKSPLGDSLRQGADRWFRHLLWTRAMREFPIYDLLAALYMIDPAGVELEERRVSVTAAGFVDYRGDGRSIRVATGFDADLLWDRFVRLVS